MPKKIFLYLIVFFFGFLLFFLSTQKVLAQEVEIWGWAWIGGNNKDCSNCNGDNPVGWMSLNSKKNPEDPSPDTGSGSYAVKVDFSSGLISGWAYIGSNTDSGAPPIGWVNFGPFTSSCGGTPPSVSEYSQESARFDTNTGEVRGWAKICSLGEAGWIKLKGSNYGLKVDLKTGFLSGFAWNDPNTCTGPGNACGLGWIKFMEPGTIKPSGWVDLFGWAWVGVSADGTNGTGWISLNCGNPNAGGCDCALPGTGSCKYSVQINTITGEMQGYAWSSHLQTWLNFKPSGPYPGQSGSDINCSSSCPTYSAKIDLNTGQLSGWAKFEGMGRAGWVLLRGKTQDNKDFGVTIDLKTMSFKENSYAWNSPNVCDLASPVGTGACGLGWIRFLAPTEIPSVTPPSTIPPRLEVWGNVYGRMGVFGVETEKEKYKPLAFGGILSRGIISDFQSLKDFILQHYAIKGTSPAYWDDNLSLKNKYVETNINRLEKEKAVTKKASDIISVLTTEPDGVYIVNPNYQVGLRKLYGVQILTGILMQGKKTIIIPDGNLYIWNNLTLAPNASIGFIVKKGDVEIGSAVTQADGLYYVPNGKFILYYSTNPFTIKGLIIAKKFQHLGRAGVGRRIDWDESIVKNPPPGFSFLLPPVWSNP